MYIGVREVKSGQIRVRRGMSEVKGGEGEQTKETEQKESHREPE